MMIGLYAGILIVGLGVGFFLAKSRYQSAVSPEQQQALEAVTTEVEQIKAQLAQLKQDKADLSYQLGESRKSLNYAEQRVEKLKQQLADQA